ncbi:MAG TPA: dihydrolipoamide acetyltransferase family protein [Desulfuromonadaceae bacterium]
MATEITMPKLSDTMTDGRFIGWRKSVGERVERGDVIAEVETDKAVMELEAFNSGVLLKVMATGGETVPVGTVLGLIGEPDEVVPDMLAAAPAASAPLPETPVQAPLSEPPVPPAAQTPAPESAPPPQPEEGHEKASPLVRRMARDAGIDLAQVQGSGPEGRILQGDLEALIAARGAGTAPVVQPGAAVTPAPVAGAEMPPQPAGMPPASAMRQAISATVTRSWHEIPHFTVTMEIDMRACAEMVREVKGGDHAVGYNALVIKGCATALGRFPRLYAATGPGISIGFAVALDDGLLVPVIRECDRRSPRDIEAEAARLADRARSGRLTQAELSGGGFTVSNLGMYGVDQFMAIIMPGQVAILAVGTVTGRPAVRDGALVVAPTMRVTLSADHRVVDGAHAAAFLAELRRILEQPLPLFL